MEYALFQSSVLPDTEPWFLFTQCKCCMDHNRTIDYNRHCTVNGVINYPLFCNCPLADLGFPAVKRYFFQYKVFVGLVRLTSSHLFSSGDFWDEFPSWFLKILKLPKFYSSNFKNFKTLGQFIPNRPPKHVITSTVILIQTLTKRQSSHW